MEIKSLEAVQKNPTIETEKQITQFLSYSATHSDIVTEYRRSGIILRIYLDTSHISEPESQSISGEYFYLGKTQHTDISHAPVKFTSAFIMQHNETYHGISHGIRIGRII